MFSAQFYYTWLVHLYSIFWHFNCPCYPHINTNFSFSWIKNKLNNRKRMVCMELKWWSVPHMSQSGLFRLDACIDHHIIGTPDCSPNVWSTPIIVKGTLSPKGRKAEPPRRECALRSHNTSDEPRPDSSHGCFWNIFPIQHASRKEARVCVIMRKVVPWFNFLKGILVACRLPRRASKKSNEVNA